MPNIVFFGQNDFILNFRFHNMNNWAANLLTWLLWFLWILKIWQFLRLRMAVLAKWPKILAIFILDFYSGECLLKFCWVWEWFFWNFRDLTWRVPIYASFIFKFQRRTLKLKLKLVVIYSMKKNMKIKRNVRGFKNFILNFKLNRLDRKIQYSVLEIFIMHLKFINHKNWDAFS